MSWTARAPRMHGCAPQLFINPAVLVHVRVGLLVAIRVPIFRLLGQVDYPLDIVNVEANEQRDIFLQLERAIEGGQRRQRLDGVERRYSRAAEGALDNGGHDGRRQGRDE